MKQTVEEAAKDFAEKQYPCVKGWNYVKSIDAFKAGAEWRINSVLHNAKEIPRINDKVIVVNRHGSVKNFGYWSYNDRISSDDMWALMDDLVPHTSMCKNCGNDAIINSQSMSSL